MSLRLQDPSIVPFAKCAYLNLIIIVFGNLFAHMYRIRQCVGEKNYKYFVSFLFLHSIWCLFLSVIGSLSLYNSIERMGFMRMSFKLDNEIVPASPLLAIQVIYNNNSVPVYDLNDIFLFDRNVLYHGGHSTNLRDIPFLPDWTRSNNKRASEDKR
jgi:hypothetical protein